ncbi:GRAM domain-containing protein [Paenibacillus thalictri]|uniref:Uncharacterized protein n=1 Tax=Paenibacillus thalictri TaxID=2527873 RepID=A0A4Q9DLG7_9BACL|nr:GRAM domain-containing protein [Paenibacillus thalictri]TBL75977.1 hypothetical protein EYB31_20660 [Paenibacillus thalictri]
MQVNQQNNSAMNVNANLFRGIEAVGGKMHITSEVLKFEPHSINIQSQPLSIRIADIAVVEKRNTLLIVPNGITVKDKSGQEYKFVVNKRDNVISHINAMIAAVPGN